MGPVTDILQARLLAVAIKLAAGVSEEERARLLDQWERVTFRIFGLCGKDARTKVGDYVRLAARVVGRDEGTRSHAQIMFALQELGRDYTVEHAVNEGLVGRACYENSPELCRYVLWLYEEYLADLLGAGATTDPQERAAIWKMGATDSVEHIFPQTPWGEPGWNGKMARAGEQPQEIQRHVDRIGNLVLLPVVLNQTARTKPFVDKKAIYEKHNLRMIRRVCQEADWTLDQIEAREAEIAEWASRRWADLES